jgi:hypothetical protein
MTNIFENINENTIKIYSITNLYHTNVSRHEVRNHCICVNCLVVRLVCFVKFDIKLCLMDGSCGLLLYHAMF